MGAGSQFERHAASARAAVTIYVRGHAVGARAGDSVAAALLAAGLGPLHASTRSRSPRAPYCMMGACFECLVVIDGVPNQQACLVGVREGMRIEPGDPDVASAIEASGGPGAR